MSSAPWGAWVTFFFMLCSVGVLLSCFFFENNGSPAINSQILWTSGVFFQAEELQSFWLLSQWSVLAFRTRSGGQKSKLALEPILVSRGTKSWVDTLTIARANGCFATGEVPSIGCLDGLGTEALTHEWMQRVLCRSARKTMCNCKSWRWRGAFVSRLVWKHCHLKISEGTRVVYA